jgi:hypothetical protein
MSRTRIHDLVPEHGCGAAQHPPILFFPLVNAHDLSLNSTGTGSITRATLECVSVTITCGWRGPWTHRVVEISVPWLTVRLIPVYHPISMDMRISINERAPIWSPDGDALDFHRRVHARVDGAPTRRDVTERAPILPFSIRMTIPSRRNNLPECALRNPIFPHLPPQLSITPHLLPRPFRLLPLHHEGDLPSRGTIGLRFKTDDLCHGAEAGDDHHDLD